MLVNGRKEAIFKAMKRLLVILAALVTTAGLSFFLYGQLRANEQEHAVRKQAIEHAQAVCQAALEARADELEKWYLADKAHTQAMAEDLNGLKSKWVIAKTSVSGNEKERKQFFTEVSRQHLHTPQACEQETAKVIAELLRDWAEEEDRMAVELGCAELFHSQEEVNMPRGERQSADHTSTLQKQVAADLATLVGSEVAAACVTRLGVSAGILGAGATLSAETFGISLVVGIVADLGVNWYLDTEGKIKQSLDEQVTKTAAEQKKKFRELMQKALDAQVSQWKKQLL